MIDGEEATSGKVSIRASKLFETEKYEHFNLDVLSSSDVTAREFVDLYLSKMATHTNGTILYIDGSEETMEDTMNGRVVCYFKDRVCGYTIGPDIWNLNVRFASLKISKVARSEVENLTLFVPRLSDSVKES